MKKNHISKIFASMLAVSMSLTSLSVLGTTTTVEAEENLGQIVFDNVSDDGADAISMTVGRTFKVLCPIPEGLNAEDVAANVKWTLTREQGFMDEEKFPFYYKGTDLQEWTKYNSTDKLFQDIQTTVSGSNIELTFTSGTFFGNSEAVNSYRQQMMDYIGDYQLQAIYNDQVIGSTVVKLNAYDSYHTMDELYREIDEIYMEGQTLDNLYVEKYSMGQSTAGLDMPYLVVAKDKAAVDNWLSITEKAENDPKTVLKDISSGTLQNYQVPILYSNVHADEVVGADCVIEFAWDLVRAAKNDATDYREITGFTEEGKTQLAWELEQRGEHASELTAEYTKWYGEITGSVQQKSTAVDLDKYYTMDSKSLNKETLADLLDDVFFILVPEENVDGRTYNTRYAAGGVDLNRDNSFQTQNETANMTHMIASWNPVSFMEMHGFVSAFQAEPCDPPHEPNFEYDLLSKHLMSGGEAFAAGAVSNNTKYNSLVMPQRDYLLDDETSPTGYSWSDPWDDMSTSYTPQYSMLHGTVAYTVEAPAANEEAMKAFEYGFITHGTYVASEKAAYLTNQCEIFERGVNNEDSDLVDPWFANQYDQPGAEAEIFRPKYAENNNFFPECYIIPLDAKNQKNMDSAYDIMEWLVRNDVKVTLTSKEFTYDNVTYPKGTMIVSMYQAKRGVANGILYDGVVIEDWSQLYSEPITAFNYTRGFDMKACTNKAVYEQIAALCGAPLTYDESAKTVENVVKASVFEGVQNHDVIIYNTSNDATAAVNELLKNGEKVGMFTEGEHKGDFVVSYESWTKVAGTYKLVGIGINEKIENAYYIKGAPNVYINGVPKNATYGYIGYNFVNNSSSNYNYDRQAFEMMNFRVTKNPINADVIVGNRKFSDESLAKVKSGTPYIGYGGTAVSQVSNLLLGEQLDYQNVSTGDGWYDPYAMDALFYCTYPTESMVTASKVTHSDDVMYGYGLNYFTKIPETAEVLVKVDGSKGEGKVSDVLMEGFIPACERANEFVSNSIQGITYVGKDIENNDVDITLFANTLTNKIHQEDEFNLISSTIFAKALSHFEYVEHYEADPVKPVTLKVTGTKATIGVKETYTIAAKATNAKLTFSSSNSKVVSVNSKGVVKGLKTGTATITIKAGTKKAVFKVSVMKAPSGIKLNKKSIQLKKGKTFQIKTTLPSKTASNHITFKSSNKSIVTVDAKGKVTAKKKGKAIVRVTTFNNKKAELKVTVY